MISALKTFVAGIAAGMLLFAGSTAMAAGSLAIDTLQGEKYGFSFNHPSVDQADQRSMRECGADCSVVLRFNGECGAYAADQTKGSNAYGWGTGSTSSSVQARAMSECRAKGGSSCKVRAWGCDAKVASAPQSASQAAAPQSASQAVAPPPARQDNRASGGGFSILGEWLVDYVGKSYTATGSLRVNENLGNGSFRGILVLEYTVYDTPKRVQQTAMITVQGDTVVINGSNPVYLLGKGSYNPDNFTLTIGSANLMRGSNSDAKGVGGAVVISRK
jgi:hypothetical protein